MQPTEAELTRYFESLEDDQLVAASAERDELTELALSVLVDELKRRRLSTAGPVAGPVHVQHLDDTSTVTLRRFASMPEALAARGALQAAGIACFLRDENAVRTMWHLTNFLGGTRLDVLETDRDAAEAALVKLDAAEDGTPVEDDVEQYVENDYVCPECGSWDVSRADLPGVIATIGGWLTSRSVQEEGQQCMCNDCKATWTDNNHG